MFAKAPPLDNDDRTVGGKSLRSDLAYALLNTWDRIPTALSLWRRLTVETFLPTDRFTQKHRYIDLYISMIYSRFAICAESVFPVGNAAGQQWPQF